MMLLVQLLRSRWFAAGAHAALWLLLYVAAINFGHKGQPYRNADAFSTPAQSVVPVAKLEGLFALGAWPKLASSDTNVLSPFFTTYFVPKPAPAPPPPTTKKIDVTYLGYYEVAGGARNVFVKMADDLVPTSVGAMLATNWFVGDASMLSLTLTNRAGQNTLVPLNSKKEIEVPLP